MYVDKVCLYGCDGNQRVAVKTYGKVQEVTLHFGIERVELNFEKWSSVVALAHLILNAVQGMVDQPESPPVADPIPVEIGGEA